jgi:hypothetical protein
MNIDVMLCDAVENAVDRMYYTFDFTNPIRNGLYLRTMVWLISIADTDEFTDFMREFGDNNV